MRYIPTKSIKNLINTIEEERIEISPRKLSIGGMAMLPRKEIETSKERKIEEE